MTEKNFEEFLRKAAQTYNAPPARTPRDEMWSAIQAKRSAGPSVVYGGGSPTVVARRRTFGPRVWMGVAAAAVLLVATGVEIGRYSVSSGPRAVVAKIPLIQTAPVVVASGNPGGEASNGQSVSRSLSGEVATRQRRQPQIASNTRQSTPDTDRSGTTAASSISPAVAGPSAAYQLATLQHLSEAEALLTSFRTRSSADQQMDAQLGLWARQLLSNTRLLLDSPVGNDPQRGPLLEDLELVLVQIVQLSPGSTSQDRELIEKTLQHDHVMTRLRTAIPAGPQRGS